jgi:hypothetical protein
MSEFDDPQLQHSLGRLSGEFPDDNTALYAVQGRVQQIRRRRTMVVSTSACLLLVTGLTFAAIRSGGSQPSQPASSGSTTGPTSGPSSTGHGSETTSASTAPGTSTPGTSAPATTPATSHPAASTTIPVVVVTTAHPVHTGGSNGHQSTTTVPVVVVTTAAPVHSTSTSTTATSTTVATTDVRTYSSVAGTITVEVRPGSVRLVSTSAAAGYVAEVAESSGQKVDVKFRGGSRDWRIRVEIKDGAVTYRVD